MKKVIIAFIAVILTALFFSTFIEENNTDKERNDDNIVISVSDLNYNLGKTKDLSKDDENIICATSRGLVKCNNNNEVIPDLVDNIEISKDGIEYNFILRDDIYWSDGERIKPEDILTYFKWMIKNENETEISALLDIYGVKSFKDGKCTFEKDVALTSYDNNIKIRLNKKDDNFLFELSKPQYKIRKNLTLWNDIKKNYKNISYSGCYYINNITDNEMELKKSDSDDSSIMLIEDDSKEDAMASYEIGERDVVIDPPVSQASRLDKNRRVLSSSSGKGIYMAINSANLSMESRKAIVKEVYKAAENYYETNKKAVKFSEGSYFERDMDELDKLQTRKVSINNGAYGEMPGRIKLLIEDNDVIENFSKAAADYLHEHEDIEVECEKKEKEDMEEYEDFDVVLFSSDDNVDYRAELYSNMKMFFKDENKRYFSDDSKIEESLFNSYSVVPIMFINKNIAVSDKVSNVKLDGNGNIDFTAIN